jgi:pimeloyl-ACP methyl ester carboxylesterase
VRIARRSACIPAGTDGRGTERRLATQPPIAVPTITLHGRDNGVLPVESSEHHARHFTGRYERRLLDRVGHNLPLETPRAFADAVLALV